MSDEKKKPEFTVSDRRLFNEEGELRPDSGRDEAPPAPEPVPAPSGAAPSIISATAPPEAVALPPEPGKDGPPPPSVAEQEAGSNAYRDAHAEVDKALNEALGSQHRPDTLKASFESFIASLYMSAMIQLGLMHERDEQPQVDLVGARHTIDTLAMLEEKTRGNLTEDEKALLQDCLFRLRMAFVEMTNALTRPPQTAPGAPPSPLKKK